MPSDIAETKEEQRIMGLEKLGLRDKSKGNEIVDLSCILIDWMSQSAVALYIYRVSGLVPHEILLQDLNLLKTLVVLGLCLDRSDPPVRPVGRARLATVPGLARPLGQRSVVPD